MPNTKLGGNRWVPDIRPDKVEKFNEGEEEYKAVDAHPILNKVLDAKAFFRTHASAVWFSKKDNKTITDALGTAGGIATLGNDGKLTSAQMPDVSNETVAFESDDVNDGEAETWTSVAPVKGGSTLASIGKFVSTMAKNVRYLFKVMGSTDISQVSDGTVTGALQEFKILQTGKMVSDWDNAVESGVYWSAGNAANVPTSIMTNERFYGSVTGFEGSAIQEVYTTAPRVSEGGGTPAKWIRFKCKGQPWQEWQNDTTADRLLKTDVVNDLLSTAADKALSAAMGKQLQDAVSKLNADLTLNLPEIYSVYNYSLGAEIRITPRPYHRFAIIIPVWSNNNSYYLNVSFTNTYMKNQDTFKIEQMPNNDGNIVTSGTFDFICIFFRYEYWT